MVSHSLLFHECKSRFYNIRGSCELLTTRIASEFLGPSYPGGDPKDLRLPIPAIPGAP